LSLVNSWPLKASLGGQKKWQNENVRSGISKDDQTAKRAVAGSFHQFVQQNVCVCACRGGGGVRAMSSNKNSSICTSLRRSLRIAGISLSRKEPYLLLCSFCEKHLLLLDIANPIKLWA
jgi:hypothetical protein